MRVLVIEDNEILSRNIVRYLSARDIFAELAMDGKVGLQKASQTYYDVVLLDINLPEMNGIEVCKQLRAKWKDTNIIMLTSNGTNEDIVTWLESGADDYLVKPFQYNELIARMNTVQRRKMQNHSATIITVNDIELDMQQVEVRKAGEVVKLSKLEYDLFKYLLQNKWKAVSREEIYNNVWWEFQTDFMFSKTVDVYIGYLRKKFWKELIETKKAYWFIIK